MFENLFPDVTMLGGGGVFQTGRVDVRRLPGTSPSEKVPINMKIVLLWNDSVVSMRSHNAHQMG